MAKNYLDHVLASGYENSDLYYLLGEVQRILGQLTYAEQDLLKALTFEVHSPKIFISLGLIYNKKHDWQKAASCITKFLTTVDTPEARFQLGLALIGLKRDSEAVIHLTKAIEMDSSFVEWIELRAQAYDRLGLADLGRRDWNTVAEMKPNYHKEHARSLKKAERGLNERRENYERNLLNRVLPEL